MGLIASVFGVIGTNVPGALIPAMYYINSYVFVDLFFERRDMVVHHLLVLSFFAANHIHEYPDAYKLEFMNHVMRFEYSTIFYSGGPLLLHYLSSAPLSASSPRFRQHSLQNVERWISKTKTGLHLGFAFTFFKYRIYDFAVQVIFSKNTYSPLHFSNRIAFVHLISTTWVFYALNLYWLQLIIWKLFDGKAPKE